MVRMIGLVLVSLYMMTGCALLSATKTVEGIEGPSRSIKIKAYVRSNEALNGLGKGFDGRSFRMRYWDINPGGIVPIHSHRGRPATIYVVNGEVLEFRNGNDETPLRHRGGEISIESEGLIHHWRNETNETVNLVASDIWASNASGDIEIAQNIRTLRGNSSGVEVETLAALNLEGEAIGVSGYTLRTRRITLTENGSTGVLDFKNGPANVFVLEGSVTQARSDLADAEILALSQSASLPKGSTVIWGTTQGPAILIVSDIIASGS